MRAWTIARYTLMAGQAVCLGVSLYQTAITAAGHIKGRPAPRPLPEKLPRFGLVICARNEERVIGDLIGDFKAQDYPPELFDVIVVAHNCTDRTAGVAREAGARVIELNTDRAGKVQAVIAGFNAVPLDYQFAGIFDADARVKPDFLRVVAGAGQGEDCLQVESWPASANWLATGYAVGRKSRNLFWWRPREALGMGVTTNGSGFFIRPTLARQLLPEMRTVTEDLELTAHLYAAGHRIAYVSATQVRIEEPHQFAPSVRQRTRWARGHYGVLRYSWPGVARRAARGDLQAFDMALYMLMPTRVLTRTGVSFSFLLALVRVPFALPMGPLLAGMAGEWGIPVAIAVRERLFPMNIAGLKLAARHAYLGMLWFPIGVWALITAGRRSWSPMPRSRPEGRDAVIL
jgi:cellulose synthase/poly-beta-1,6-N-acetylglucosamine synthase-like glycosyltransferase